MPLALALLAAQAIDLPRAMRLAEAAISACASEGAPASASVVDSDGNPLVVARSPASPKPPVAAPAKAAAAALFDSPGSVMEPREKTDPAFAAQIAASAGKLNPHGGSLPLHRGGKVIGGLAVADVDHALADRCARSALDTVAPELR
jgi:uncharacterized protein GlcG (DUF336 family)